MMGSYLTYVIGALFILLLLLLLLLPSILIRLFLVLLVENGDDHCKIWEREKKKKNFSGPAIVKTLMQLWPTLEAAFQLQQHHH